MSAYFLAAGDGDVGEAWERNGKHLNLRGAFLSLLSIFSASKGIQPDTR